MWINRVEPVDIFVGNRQKDLSTYLLTELSTELSTYPHFGDNFCIPPHLVLGGLL
jgi:hypothetical protein